MIRRKIASLGLVASSKRTIQDGKLYEGLFPKTTGADPYLNQDGSVYDTVEYCSRIVASTLEDTKGIAKLLVSKSNKSLEAFCKNIFDFTFNNYQYEVDKAGVEQLRTPARAFRDRKSGIDCDCFSITISSILSNAGIPHYFRIVKMYNRDYFQHIYIVVPRFKGANMNDKKNYITIDPVLDKHNYEAPGITFKQDRAMTLQGMPIQLLNGVDTVRFGEEFNGIGESLGDFRDDSVDGPAAFNRDYLSRMKRHLQNTRKVMITDPRRFKHVYNVKRLGEAFDQLLGVWDNDQAREAMLEKLCCTEEQLLIPQLQGLGDIIHGTDDELFGLLGVEFDGLEGLDGKKMKARRAAKAAGSPKKKTGVFTRVKNANKKIKNEVSKLKSKEGRKEAFKKVKRAFLKTNPAIIPLRLAFLAGLKINFGRISSHLYWGYFTLAQAKAAGVTESFWRKSTEILAKVENTFVGKLGGDKATLKKAIVNGRAAKVVRKLAKKGKLNGINELLGVNGLGEPATAVVVAALPFLTAVVAMINKAFKNKNGKMETETGGEESEAPLTESDAGMTAKNDYSASTYDQVVNNPVPPTMPDNTTSNNSGGETYTAPSKEYQSVTPGISVQNATASSENAIPESSTPPTTTPPTTVDEGEAGGDPPAEEEKKSNNTVALLALALGVGGVALMTKGKKDKKPLNGPTKNKPVIKLS